MLPGKTCRKKPGKSRNTNVPLVLLAIRTRARISLGSSETYPFVHPQDERTLRQGEREDDPEWDAERERLFSERGLLAFDLFAPKALALLTGSAAYRQLVAERYPLIIVDEAQDTGTDQWACVAALADLTQLVCLADLDQRTYDSAAMSVPIASKIS